MNEAQIQDILNTVKTWNVNINDATTQKLADQVLPLAQQYLWLHFIEQIILAAMIIISLSILSKAVFRIVTTEK